MKFKYKLLTNLTVICSSLFFLNGCETMKKAGQWIEEQYDKYDARMEAIPTPIDEKIFEMKESAYNVTLAILESKQILLDAQGRADEAQQIEAALATLKSSPTEDVSAITTAYNDTKEISIEYNEQKDLVRKEMNAHEWEAVNKILLEIPQRILITFKIHGEISEIQKPYSEKLRLESKLRRQYKDSSYSIMTDEERDMIYAMNHKSFKLLALYRILWDASVAVYDLVAYSLDQGDISSEEKDTLNAVFQDLDANKVDPSTIEEMGNVRPEGIK